MFENLANCLVAWDSKVAWTNLGTLLSLGNRLSPDINPPSRVLCLQSIENHRMNFPRNAWVSSIEFLQRCWGVRSSLVLPYMHSCTHISTHAHIPTHLTKKEEWLLGSEVQQNTPPPMHTYLHSHTHASNKEIRVIIRTWGTTKIQALAGA